MHFLCLYKSCGFGVNFGLDLGSKPRVGTGAPRPSIQTQHGEQRKKVFEIAWESPPKGLKGVADELHARCIVSIWHGLTGASTTTTRGARQILGYIYHASDSACGNSGKKKEDLTQLVQLLCHHCTVSSRLRCIKRAAHGRPRARTGHKTVLKHIRTFFRREFAFCGASLLPLAHVLARACHHWSVSLEVFFFCEGCPY
jgi:hypothetical protein